MNDHDNRLERRLVTEHLTLARPLRTLLRRPLVACDQESTLGSALAIMQREGVGSIVVLDQHKRPVGIFTERDLLAVSLLDRLGAPIAQSMSRDPISLPDYTPAYEAALVMVDQRIRQALHILGVERRSQAARLVARYSGPYQRLIHQSPHIERPRPSGHPEAAVSHQIRHADRAGEADGAGFRTEQRAVAFAPSLQLPFATRSNPRNEMSVGQRLFWIAAIAIGSAFSAGMYLAGLESLARLLRS